MTTAKRKPRPPSESSDELLEQDRIGLAAAGAAKNHALTQCARGNRCALGLAEGRRLCCWCHETLEHVAEALARSFVALVALRRVGGAPISGACKP